MGVGCPGRFDEQVVHQDEDEEEPLSGKRVDFPGPLQLVRTSGLYLRLWNGCGGTTHAASRSLSLLAHEDPHSFGPPCTEEKAEEEAQANGALMEGGNFRSQLSTITSLFLSSEQVLLCKGCPDPLGRYPRVPKPERFFILCLVLSLGR